MHLSTLNSHYGNRKRKKGRKQYDFGIGDYYTYGSRVIWVVRSHVYLNLPGSRCPAFGQRACGFRILLSYIVHILFFYSPSSVWPLLNYNTVIATVFDCH